MALDGSLWIPMTPLTDYGTFLFPMDSYTYLWLPQLIILLRSSFCGLQWIPVARRHFCSLGFSLAPYGSIWLSKAFYGFLWLPMS